MKQGNHKRLARQAKVAPDKASAVLADELAAAKDLAMQQQRRAEELSAALKANAAERTDDGHERRYSANEVEATEMENEIFSKAMDRLREECDRLRAQNEKMRTECARLAAAGPRARAPAAPARPRRVARRVYHPKPARRLKEARDERDRSVCEASRLQVEVSSLRRQVVKVGATPAVPEPPATPAVLPPVRAGAAASSVAPSASLDGALFSMRLSAEDRGKLRGIAKQTRFHEVTVDQLFEVFKQHAAGGQQLDRRGFLAAIDALAVCPPSHRFIFDSLYGLFDRDDSGTVDFGEFVGGLSVLCKGEADQKLKLLFALLDADGSSLVSKAELSTFFMTAHAVSRGLKAGAPPNADEVRRFEPRVEAEISAIIAAADTNADGQLSWEEFYTQTQRADSALVPLLEMFNAVASDGIDDAVAVSESECQHKTM